MEPNPLAREDEEDNEEVVERESGFGRYWALLILASFLFGNTSGYFFHAWQSPPVERIVFAEPELTGPEAELARLAGQVHPHEGYTIPAVFKDTGPKMLEAGAMAYDVFLKVYDQAGSPLSEQQKEILLRGSQEQVVINRENAYFLLNYFWALGLTNRNPILTEGMMVQNSQGRVEQFASTGGWSIAAKPIGELYASADIVVLTADQQERLEKVAPHIFRPCCNHPTHFPDCNHGMALLGLLQLMASQGASEEEMFEAAKYVNAFWFPDQNMALASFFSAKGVDYADVDAATVVSSTFSSSSGFQSVYQWLASNNQLPQAPGGGGGCGV
jgi:hypothetical protein